MPDPTTEQRWGKLSFSDGSSYQLTEQDMLWLARSTSYEGGPADITVWTLAQRFAQFRKEHGLSLTAFLRAFSQPINLDWERTGRYCRSGGAYANRLPCSGAALDLRDQAARATWAELDARTPEAVATVIAWGQGRVPNRLPRSTNFADPTVSSHYIQHAPGTKLLLKADNWYLQEAWANTWSRNHVRVVSTDGAIADADGIHPARGPAFAFLNTMLRSALARPFAWRV